VSKQKLIEEMTKDMSCGCDCCSPKKKKAVKEVKAQKKTE